MGLQNGLCLAFLKHHPKKTYEMSVRYALIRYKTTFWNVFFLFILFDFFNFCIITWISSSNLV
jgi:hypothetical protein